MEATRKKLGQNIILIVTVCGRIKERLLVVVVFFGIQVMDGLILTQ
jgi:hypothetical protein